MEKEIIINVGKSKLLGVTILKLLHEHGRNRAYPDESGFMDSARMNYFREDTFIYDDGKYLSYSGSRYFHSDVEHQRQYTLIDAATEMGKLIDLLEAPKEVIVKGVAQSLSTTTPMDAVISSDGKTVKVGCSTATFEKVEETYLKMKELRS